LACVFVLAVLLRLYDFTARSLWNDEGITLRFVGTSWPDVLGFHGQYDPHPPLYYALVKLTGLAVPELVAGRLLSLIAGSLTILVLYELTRRLVNAWAGLVAAVVLCVSPIHIWYSQEARQYALTVLLVAISYLALVAYRQGPHIGWAVAYAISTAIAVYIDYSALFALAPQVVLLALVAREQKRRSVPLFGCLALAILAYLPWIPQLIISVQQEGTIRESFLGLSPERFVAALGSLVGLQDQDDYFQRDMAAVWRMWEPLRVMVQVTAVAVVILCAVLAWKGSRPALLVACLLSFGTIAVTTLVSFFSPSFASRTVLGAVLGWAIFMGMLVAGRGMPELRRGWKRIKMPATFSVGLSALLLALIVSAVAFGAANADISLQRGPHWSDLTAAISQAAGSKQNFVIVVPSKIDYTLIDAYKPGVLDGRAVTSLDDLSKLPPSDLDVWMAYHRSTAFAPYFDELARLGYVRVQQMKFYPGALLLDRYHLAARQTSLAAR
jgi:4-amino-4-deoxy-L-arabinose transferase-like glycosyltransferase